MSHKPNWVFTRMNGKVTAVYECGRCHGTVEVQFGTKPPQDEHEDKD